MDTFAGKEKAIQDMDGRVDLYEKHVSRFKDNYIDADVILIGMLRSGQLDEAARHIHSIKGLAGTLGMLPLSLCCAVIEDKLRTGQQDTLQDDINSFSRLLSDICKRD